jgi:signal transduction histidine kinase/CheY-like chemotaxis protein
MSEWGPRYVDVRDPVARENHKPVSCPDKILTAFCQLGALRLQARRCLIFFFDVNHAYIMAESTKTLSLENDAVHAPGDEIWLGHSAIPRDIACCETTVNLPSFPISAADNGDTRKSAFIVNDLTKHPDLSTRPYVTGYPNGRFYAGVPITTSSGVNIGAYCILDDKVREGVSDEDLVFLRDMSQTVMAHLETVRALSERQQVNRMVAGLGDFVRGASDAGRQVPPATNMPLSESGARDIYKPVPDALRDPMKTPVATSSLAAREYFNTQHRSASQVSGNGSVAAQPSSDCDETPLANDENHGLLDHQKRKDALNSTAPSVEDFSARPPPHPREKVDDLSSTYQRAAEILCHSLDIDGVAFLDASVHTFGGLSEAPDAESNEGSAAGSDDSAGTLSQSDSSIERRVNGQKVCKVLGCAQRLQTDMAEPGLPGDQPLKKLTESFLRKLMHRNPRGKIWTFDEDFKTHSDLSSDDSSASVQSAGQTAQQRKAARKDPRSDAERLQAAFPGSRCIALHGIWDYTKRRWATAGLYWTHDPLRNITKHTEMQFVAAFCDIIVAETKRLEVLETDKAKSDFISSVSHELRSPLHGILGSCELLSDHGLDETARIFLEQIDSCGRTLLEIIEHLLDLANFKSQRLRKGAVKSSKIGRNIVPPVDNVSADGLKALDTSVALDDVTEDTVISCVASFNYGRKANERTHTPVILDIDRSNCRTWHCSLATGGWKRVCINLVTNALKYTPTGSIRVSLKQEPKPGSRRRFNAVLTVSDTGKGMSRKFQSDGLFHSFAQEDTLSDGLGLGMHLVSRIIYAMDGKIDVVSNQDGTGTCVTVCVPLEHNLGSRQRSDVSDKSTITTPKHLPGLKVGLVTRSQAPSDPEPLSPAAVSAMALASIEKNLEYMGLPSERFKWRRANPYDLIIVMEDDAAECIASLDSGRTADGDSATNKENHAPIIVVCHNSQSAQMLPDFWAGVNHQFNVVVATIALPCGIKQINRAISSALRLHKTPTAALSDILGAQEKPSNGLAGGIATYDLRTVNQLPLRPLATTLAAIEIPVMEQTQAGATLFPSGPTPALPMRSPARITQNQQSEPGSPDEPSAGTLGRLNLLSHHLETPAPSTILPTVKIPTLLLVEDNAINLRILITFAKKYKYPNITAQNGQLAVEAFEQAHIDSTLLHKTETGMPSIILMDINMPVMDGYEAVQRIRAYERKHRLVASKIIAVTALQSEAAQVEAFGSGFDLFLSKPIKMKELAKLLEAF